MYRTDDGVVRALGMDPHHDAEQLGDRRLTQHVRQAVGLIPLCAFIPCHRIVGPDGSLTEYTGGLERKRWLLELEEPAEAPGSRMF